MSQKILTKILFLTKISFMKKIYIILIFGLIFLINNQVFSQSDIADIKKAEENYKIGKFETVEDDLLEILKNKDIEEKTKFEAYRLLAKTYLAIDDNAKAEEYIFKILEIDMDYKGDVFNDPLIFVDLVEKVISEQRKVYVTSVSKKAEDIKETPATVALITKDNFKEKGYLDFEAMLYDLPGFDISRSNGNLYTHVYQRGYRSINTNRTLFLIDGIEDNDLWSSNVYLTRQFTLSNLKSVEIVYGPASTMYGSNAFLGVINILTVDPDEIISNNKNIGFSAVGGYGSYNTRFLDATLAAKDDNGNISFSITGRGFFSNEMDFSKFDGYGYKPREYNDSISSVYHNALDIKDSSKVASFLAENPETHNYYYLNDDYQIILTEDGIKHALELDNTVYSENQYSDITDNRTVYAKLNVFDLKLGFMTWNKNEGAGAQYTDVTYFTGKQGQNLSPKHTTMYAKYEKKINEKLYFSNFATYKIHGFDENTRLVRFRNYRYSTGKKYSLENLLESDIPRLDSTYFFYKSSQLRDEIKLYIPLEKLDILTGVEARFSVLQGDYNSNSTGNAEETGTPTSDMPSGNHFFIRDIGVYAQSTYNITDFFKLTAGLRYDNNKIRNTGGYGNVFNPRLAVLLLPKTFIIKIIYAEAFKDATNREKFSIVAGKRELTNPSLKPEKVKNLEFSLGKTFFDEDLYVNFVGYYAKYSNIIQEVSVNTTINGVAVTTNQNQGVGEQEVYGIHAFANFKFKDFDFYANYTFTNPWVLNPTESDKTPMLDENGNAIERLRVSDIANHQANFGANYFYKKHLNINLRTNFVGERIVGENTTVPTNTSTFNPYLLLHTTVSYTFNKFDKFENLDMTVQLLINNLTNKEYYSPGLDEATGDLSPMLPQNGINLHLKLFFKI